MPVYECIENGERFTIEAASLKQAKIDATLWGAEVIGKVKVFHAQIFNNQNKTWNSMHPSGEPPYQFDSRKDAHDTLKMCYPDHYPDTTRFRIKEA